VWENDGADLVRHLAGRRLNEVAFARDYVQFDFDGLFLNAVALPTIRAGRRRFAPGEPGYGNALSDQIGRSVENTSLRQGDALRISFDDGGELAISLRPMDHTDPEVAVYASGGELWVK
jgi:hypothetical protein